MNKRFIGTAAFLISFLFWASLFAETETVDIHGFISQGYMKTTDNNLIYDSEDGTFQFNELGIHFGSQLSDRMYIGIQFFARDFGSLGNDEIQIDYALADYRMRDWFGIRAGRMKNPMGFYSEYRDIDMLRTSIILPSSVYDETLRDSETFANGVSVYGDINTPSIGSFSYQALAGANNIGRDSATAVTVGIGLIDISSVELDTIYSYSLQYADPSGCFKIGGTAFFSNLSAEGESIELFLVYGVPLGTPVNFAMDNLEIYTAGVEFTYGNLKLAYEYKYTKARNYSLSFTNAPAGTPPLLNTAIDQVGGYFMIDYQINEILAAGVYYNEYYPFKDNQNGDNPTPSYVPLEYFLKQWAFSGKITLSPSWLLKFETHYNEGAAGLIRIYNEDGYKKHWWLFAGKLSYNF